MKDPDFLFNNRLEDMDIPGDWGIYIHVPFCVRRCKYCAFVSSVRRPVPDWEYARDICTQFEMQKPENAHWTTLYLGGGTPTTLSDDALIHILETIGTNFDRDVEITLEANPEHVTRERAQAWKSAGITRISLGIQSFEDDMLHFLGRGHDRKKALNAIETLEKSGFDEISVDLIYGANPGSDEAFEIARWKNALQLVKSLPVGHLSCYELTLEENTPLWTAQKNGQTILCSEDAILEMMACIEDFSGMTQYEISNYSRGGYLSRHNVSCWAGVPYLGLGAAAHSLIRRDGYIERHANLSNVRKWMLALGKKSIQFPLEFCEKLSSETHLAERLMLAARTRFWWSPKTIADSLKCSERPFMKNLSKAVEEELLEMQGGFYRTTSKGIRLNNRIDELIFI
ncbi:MAG: radical SAM family heme chaperone HemW [Proteobacteria bacterium]|nr:radical SAM family heme chaperone HemW [Pseudomonadota bacterium]